MQQETKQTSLIQKDWLNMAIKNIFRNKRRSVLSGLAILVVAASMTLMAAFTAGMRNELMVNLRALDTGDVTVQHKDFVQYRIFNPLGYLINLETLKDSLKEQKDIKIYGRTSFFANYYNNENNVAVQVFAFNDDDELAKSIITLDEGRFAMTMKEAVVGRGLAKDKNIKVGESVMVMSGTADRASNAVSYKVVGIADMKTGGYNANAIIPNLEGAAWLIRTPEVTGALITTKNNNVNNLVKYINSNLDKDGYHAISKWDSRLGIMMQTQRKFTRVIMIIFFILGSTVVINTAIMVIMERIKEIGILRAMGTTIKEVQTLFFLESLFLSITGTIVGLTLGCLLTIPLANLGNFVGNPQFKDVMEGFYISGGVPMLIVPSDLLSIFALSMIVSILVATLPTRKIATINVCDSLRVEN